MDNGGGGLLNDGTATLTDCTIEGNSAHDGGGLLNGNGTATLTDCTVTGNSAAMGAGLYNMIGDTTLTDTIVAGQTGGADIRVGSGSVSGNNNLIGDGSGISGGTGNLLGTTSTPINPLLAPLGDYGGPTPTMALLPGSPAIGAGISGTGIPTTDQRGYARGSSRRHRRFPDQGFTLTPVAGSTPQSAFAGTTFANPLAVTVTANNASQFTNPVDGGVITYTANAVNGAAATLSAPRAVIQAVTVNGQTSEQASVTATANTVVGSYTVTALATGVRVGRLGSEQRPAAGVGRGVLRLAAVGHG